MGSIRTILCIVYIVIAILLGKDYLQWNLTTVFGLLLVPLVYQVEKGILSTRLILPSILFVILAIAIPTRSTLFFALLFTFLLLIESFKGKVSSSVLYIFVLISPLFKTFSDSLSFPLRLWLTDVVAKTLAAGGTAVTSIGNIIRIDGFDFYIDQACAGLNMLNISLLVAVFVISSKLKTMDKDLRPVGYLGIILITIFLNLASNYFRIMAIVLFKIMPGTALHDGIGIISLIVYVLIPLMFLAPHYIGKIARTHPKIQEQKFNKPRFLKPYLHIGLFCAIMYTTYFYKTAVPVRHDNKAITMNGFNKSKLENEVLKFENPDALIYMKPCNFYSPEHNPMICWTGSGYEFTFIKKEIYSGVEIYTGMLVKGKDKLYTSWWFDDGQTKTIDQYSWRWKGAMGKKFYLINVASSKQADLKRITNGLLPSPFAGNP